jgi:hypothetical protein
MFLLSRDEKINEIVKGKNVCLCGPAAYLVGSNLGRFIDSFDVVCRVNDFTPIDHTQDYGRKNDIMFHVFSDLWFERDEFRDFIKNNYSFYECIKLFVCATRTKKPHGPWDKDVKESYNEYTDGFDKKPFTSIAIEDFLKIKKELKEDFSTGRVIEQMLLACEIKSLFITGFSFYWENDQIPKRFVYYPEKVVFWGKRYTSFDQDGFLISTHNQSHQKEYFIEKVLKLNKDKIIIDSFLRDEVLKIDYDNTIKVNWKK